MGSPCFVRYHGDMVTCEIVEAIGSWYACRYSWMRLPMPWPGRKAFAENKSLADVVRDALTQYLTSSGAQSSEVDRFTFIGSGESLPEGPSPLSERHDDALAEDYVT